MCQEFAKANLEEEWMDLVNEFPEFILELSPCVLEIFNKEYHNEVDLNSVCNLRYGFECNVGWKNIIREYFTNIRNLIQDAKNNGHEIHYKTFIMKEKFGELRDQGDFYGPDKSLYWNRYVELSREAMQKSSKTCELCGEPGKLLRKGKNWGWIKCLCEKHALEKQYGLDAY